MYVWSVTPEFLHFHHQPSIKALEKNIETTLSLIFTFSPSEGLSSFDSSDFFVFGRQRPSLFAWFVKKKTLIHIKSLEKIAVRESLYRLLLVWFFGRIIKLDKRVTWS